MNDIKRRHIGKLQLLALAGLLAFTLGCPQTDATLYSVGESGDATLRNPTRRAEIWLGGCNAFEQEKLENGSWINQGGDIPCLWEGLASPLPAGAERIDAFRARAPGTWRLAYPIGFGCRADQPLHEAHCRRVTRVVSNEFEVAAIDANETFCTDSGGTWDVGSCGDYSCGAPPICAAVIPGCDCGPDANFVSGVGCVDDPICTDPGGQQALCEDTGGSWDPLSCGHYSCGERPDCRAVIPGCDCGFSAVFDDTLGCLAVPCGAPRD